MNAGPTESRVRWAWLLGLSACLAACERRASDPPPPPLRHELVSAAPGALGARIASRTVPPPALTSEGEPSPSPHHAPAPEPSDAPDETVPPAAPTVQPPPQGVEL